MNQREHAVLSLFYNEGHRELTPSFLAYRMRMRTGDSTALLDGMVKHGILDLRIDDEGNLTYRLPPGEQERLDRAPRAASHPPMASPGSNAPFGRRRPNQAHPGPSPSGPPGTDASTGYAENNQSPSPFSDHRRTLDGTDGSVATYRPVAGSWNSSGPVGPVEGTTKAYSQGGPHRAADNGYGYGAGNANSGPHSGPQAPTGQPHWGYPPGSPNHQPMAPYESTHPAHPPHRASNSHPVVAGVLSFFLPGLGQFYNGEIGKGILLLFSYAFLWIFYLFPIVWAWSVIDAFMVAEYRNQRALNAEPQQPAGLLTDQQHHRGSNTNSNAA